MQMSSKVPNPSSSGSGLAADGRGATLRLAGSAVGPTGSLDVAKRHVYLIGIGGSGMAGMARMLRARGAHVSGSDQGATSVTDALEKDGIDVGFVQTAEMLPKACDLVVASAAIKDDHPQVVEAIGRGILVLSYAQALGACMKDRTAVCIAGTHGKSTTTSMVSCVLSDCGISPTTIVGATCAQLGGSDGQHGGGFVLGTEEVEMKSARSAGVLIAESCEFNRSFHNYEPTVAAITSVEADHLDVYGTLDGVIESFNVFARKIKDKSKGGVLFIAHDGAHRREVTRGVSCEVQTVGFHPDADWYVTYDNQSKRATLLGPDRAVAASWSVLIPGSHNALNGAFAAAIAVWLGSARARVEESLSKFGGVDRRAQVLGQYRGQDWASELPGVKVYDDYGHHPTEVEVTLKALRQFEKPQASAIARSAGGGRLICVFQPHQHSRTRHLLEEFANSFGEADVVLVPHIYFVRDSEEDRTKVTAQTLVDRLREKGVDAMHLYPFSAIVGHLRAILKPGDVVVVMGAGPVNQIGFELLGKAVSKG